MYSHYLKRIFDIIIASVLLILLSPLMLLTSFLVRVFLGTPVFFKQHRPGLNEKPFLLYKFRTMLDKRNSKDELLNDDHRLNAFSKCLRSLSIDELPELINVLKGEMSLVGPRPLLMEYLPYYSTRQRLRHSMRPGLTGWAQINGRNSLSWEKKFEFDTWYIENCSFLLDCKIILLTLVKIIKREGIHAQGLATMSRFDHEFKKTRHD
jgi:lipopolysaccharide/colanic/teichoic acid biosynthesis glycosyltransferase